jgi:hypothetical protein
LGLAAPGTGAGGAAVVEIATVLFGSLNVMKPIPMPFTSFPVGRPASKSSMTGSVAARAGATAANGEANMLMIKLKIRITENAGCLYFIAFLLVNLISMMQRPPRVSKAVQPHKFFPYYFDFTLSEVRVYEKKVQCRILSSAFVVQGFHIPNNLQNGLPLLYDIIVPRADHCRV